MTSSVVSSLGAASIGVGSAGAASLAASSAASAAAAASAFCFAACARLSGASTIVMFRPSMRGKISTRPTSFTASSTWSRIFLPSSGWYTSRPRKVRVTFTLWPSARKCSTLRVLVSKSPPPIFGRYFISLMTTLLVLRRDSLAFWAASYLYLP